MGYNLFGNHLTPTECYLTDVVGEDAWKDIDTCTSDVNDLFDRLYLGLSITPQDYRDLFKILRDFSFKREDKRRRRH